MKLSDAIALGRVLCKPVPGTQDDTNGGGCALGMGARALNLRALSGFGLHELNTPSLKHRVTLPCKCRLNPSDYWYGTLGGAIAHVFNEHVFGVKNWTLDQLIDFVRQHEPAEPEQEPAIERITVRPREIKNLEPLNDWETGQVQPEDKALAQVADEHFDFRAGTR